MNQLISKIFYKELTQIISHQKYIDARVPPSQLLKELTSIKQRKLLIEHVRESKDSTKRLRVLSVIGVLILFSDDFYELIEENLFEQSHTNTWIEQSVLNPFCRWIKKCCETSNFYKQTKGAFYDSRTFIDRLPYIINLLYQIVDITKLIPKFGRYFNLQQDNKVYIMFSQILMTLTNTIYAHLKKNLDLFLLRQKEEIIYDHKQILKWVFTQVVPPINETLITVTNNKHFKFYKKGIATKTLKLHECTNSIQKIITNLESSAKSKSTQLQSLQSQLFPEDGSFNEGLFLSTLQGSFKSDQISQISEVFNKSSPQLKIGKVKSYKIRKEYIA